MNNKAYSRIKDVCNAAIHSEVSSGDVADMTLHSKCTVIQGLVGALRDKVPQAKYGSGKHTRKALEMLVTSLKPSDAFLDFQDKKRSEFLSALSFSQYEGTRNLLRDWDNSDNHSRRQAIFESTDLHKNIYLQGCIPVLSTGYNFVATEPQCNARSRHAAFFAGNIENGEAYIQHHYEEEAGLLGSPYLNLLNRPYVLEMSHHEMTHAIQFCFAYAMHHNQIQPNHPLYDDARMFHAIEVKKAYVPSQVLPLDDQGIYCNQPQELLAFAEGRAISASLLDAIEP